MADYRKVAVRQDPPRIAHPVGTSMLFSGGPEATPRVEVVESNYHARRPGDALLQITGPCSLETLQRILSWAQGRGQGPVEPEPTKPRSQLDLMEEL